MLGFAVRFALCLIIIVVVGTALIVSALYLSEGDCIWARNEHLARCK